MVEITADLHARTWTERERKIYEIGHQEGESSASADWLAALSEAFDVEPFDGPSDFIKGLRVWVYQGRELMVFATEEAAQAWFDKNDPEGVAFACEVIS